MVLLTTLTQVLQAIGEDLVVRSFLDGSRVLILPHGGRVLGLFTPDSDENFLWTNPAFEHPAAAKDFFASPAWHNSGGDRTWLAPELDYFFPRFPDLSFYWQPRTLDPGGYSLEAAEDRIILRNRFSVTASRSKQSAELEITREVSCAVNPIHRGAAMSCPDTLAYAGYRLVTRLKNRAQNNGMPAAGLWSLLQLPIHGEFFVSVRQQPRITRYAGEVDFAQLRVSDRLCRWEMRGPGVKKLGWDAQSTTGRAAYLYSAGKEMVLVVREFHVNPLKHYVDVPRHLPSHTGDAVQACVVDNQFGQFSELEYHAPAIGGGSGETDCEDVSEVWAYRGNPSDICDLRKTLLPD